MTPRLHLVIFGGEPIDPMRSDSAAARMWRAADAFGTAVASTATAPSAAEKPGG